MAASATTAIHATKQIRNRKDIFNPLLSEFHLTATDGCPVVVEFLISY